jgi:hypothetical protein
MVRVRGAFGRRVFCLPPSTCVGELLERAQAANAAGKPNESSQSPLLYRALDVNGQDGYTLDTTVSVSLLVVPDGKSREVEFVKNQTMVTCNVTIGASRMQMSVSANPSARLGSIIASIESSCPTIAGGTVAIYAASSNASDDGDRYALDHEMLISDLPSTSVDVVKL